MKIVLIILAIIIGVALIVGLAILIFLLLLVLSKINHVMNRQDQIDAANASLGTAIDAVSQKITDQTEQIAAGTVTDESMDLLNSNIARLQSLVPEATA